MYAHLQAVDAVLKSSASHQTVAALLPSTQLQSDLAACFQEATSCLSLQEYFLGSGGVFGLLQALVGEVLPGSARCVAVGNALLQGPVVFHFPQYVVGRIKERAMEGDKAVMQLLVDLYR